MSKEEYVTFYKYMSLEHAVDTIEKGQLYLNDGKDFNDPFENTVRNNKKRLHILCLTSGFQKMLMWSHYADSHKGICLTVEVPKSLVYNICYTTERPLENSNLDEIINRSITAMKMVKKPPKILTENYSSLSDYKKIAYIKSKEWSYEKEFRIVLDDRDVKKMLNKEININGEVKKMLFENPTNGVKKLFMNVNITNVYLGVGFINDYQKKEEELKAQEQIIRACERKGIPTKQMELSDTKYELRVAKRQYILS